MSDEEENSPPKRREYKKHDNKGDLSQERPLLHGGAIGIATKGMGTRIDVLL